MFIFDVLKNHDICYIYTIYIANFRSTTLLQSIPKMEKCTKISVLSKRISTVETVLSPHPSILSQKLGVGETV